MFEPEIETDCTLAARQPVEERQQINLLDQIRVRPLPL